MSEVETLRRIFRDSMVDDEKPYTMQVHGNRPGDIAARAQRPGDRAMDNPRPGDIAAQTARPGDIVPCRRGDIIMGICGPNQTAASAETSRMLNEVLSSIKERIEEHTRQANSCLDRNRVALQQGSIPQKLEPCF